ncbi:MAG: hypothetical protein ACI8ZW_000466, partial [Yoonia sp.]
MPSKKKTLKKNVTLNIEAPELSQRSIIIALDWYDERVVRGIYNYSR